MSTYSEKHKKYYQKHKEEINEREKENRKIFYAEWRKNNAEDYAKYMQEYRLENRMKIADQRRAKRKNAKK